MACLICSCKKDKSGSDDRQPIFTPIKTEHGKIIGNRIEAVIGSEGGIIEVNNSNIKIEIPAGSVTVPTTFALVPIDKKLSSGSGTAYRLEPANVDLKKDIKITLHYELSDLNGTPEDFLYMAYQDNQSIWHRSLNSQLDKANKLLTVQTRHLGDWVVERAIYLDQKKANFSENETSDVLLKMVDIGFDGVNDDVISFIDLEKFNNPIIWKIHGRGKLKEGRAGHAVYTAPSGINGEESSNIEVAVKNLLTKRNPSRLGQSNSPILFHEIFLVPEEFMSWTLDGQSYKALKVNSMKNLGVKHIAGYDEIDNSANILFRGTTTGHYPYGNLSIAGNGFVGMYISEVSYPSDNMACDPLNGVYSDGEINITRYDSEFIEGIFKGKVYVILFPCTGKTKQFLGKFRIKNK